MMLSEEYFLSTLSCLCNDVKVKVDKEKEVLYNINCVLRN